MSLLGSAAKLLASLDLDTKPFEAGQKRVNRDLGQMESRFQKVSTRSIAVGTAIGHGVERIAEFGISKLSNALQAGEQGLIDLQNAQAQTNAVIQSTGGKAGITAAKVRELAEAQESITTVDDKVVQSGENMLLTFTNIGKDVFPQATKAMVDMAVAMNGGNAEGIDLKNTAIQVGKALNDPIKGVGALRRVGVQLTDAQQKQITTLLSLTKDEQAHYLKLKQSSKAEAEKYKEQQIGSRISQAQKIILGELTTEFGKAGEAAGNSGASGLVRFRDAIEDTEITLASGFAPALDRIRTKIAEGLTKPSTQAAVRHLGEWLGDAAESGLKFAESIPWEKVGDGLKTAAGFAGKLIDTFAHLPPGVQGTIIGLAGLNKLSGGGVIKVGVDLFETGAKGLLGQFVSRGSPANPMFVVAEGGLGGAGGVAGAAKGGLGLVGKMFLVGEAIGLVEAVNAVKDKISGDLLGQAQQVGSTLTDNLEHNPQTIGTLKTQLAAIDTGIDRISSNPLNVLVGGQALDELKLSRQQLVAAIEKAQQESTRNLQPLPDKISAKQERKFNALRDKIEGSRIATVTAQHGTTTQLRSTGRGIEGAIRALNLSPKIVVPISVSVRGSLATATWVSRVTRLTANGLTS